MKFEKLAANARIHGTVYRVMYTTRSVHEEPTVATGVVIVPNGLAPRSGFPVASWAHGTTGMADQCSPSIPGFAPPGANALLDRRFEVVSTDYAGEGSPGVLPYIVGVSAARSAIDIVRAAQHLPPAHASRNYVVWGYSEGGHTAMFALDIAASYAPELHLKGVVAGAAPADLPVLFANLEKSPYSYYLVMLLIGMNAAYGTKAAPLDEVLTAAGLRLVPTFTNTCLTQPTGVPDSVRYIFPYGLRRSSTAKLIKVDPFTIAAWNKVLTQNDPVRFTNPRGAPLLIVQGGKDEEVAPATSDALVRHECGLGQHLQRWIYPGGDHAFTLIWSAVDMTHWIADRFAAKPVPDPYVPTGQSDVKRSDCAGGAG